MVNIDFPKVVTTVFILDGSSEDVAHMWTKKGGFDLFKVFSKHQSSRRQNTFFGGLLHT